MKIGLLFFLLILPSAFAATYYIELSESTIDGNSFCNGKCKGGDTLIIRGGIRGRMLFENFDGQGQYITITNDNSNNLVDLENYDHSSLGQGIFNIVNCHWVDFRGDGSPHFQYGIKLTNYCGPDVCLGAALRVYEKASHIKLGYFEIDDDESLEHENIGIIINDMTQDGYTYEDFEIHHNYIHSFSYSCMYFGCPQGQPTYHYIAGFSVHDNLITDCGYYGMTMKSANGPNNYIYNNMFKRIGTYIQETCDNKAIGIRNFESGYHVEVYDNWIEYSNGPGVMILGSGHIVHDNVILGVGVNDDSYTCDHGIYLEGGSSDVEIYDNIILQSEEYGIFLDGWASNTVMERNKIGDCGSGEHNGGNLIEGTGSNANIYYDNIANFGFPQWSDDGNYGNDVFYGSSPTTCTDVGRCCDSCSGTSFPAYNVDCSGRVCCSSCQAAPSCNVVGQCCDACVPGTEETSFDGDCPGVCCTACQNQPAVLAGHWKLNGDALDAVGTSHGGVSEAIYVQGRYGEALDFDGIDDYMTINDPGTNSYMDLTGDFSISLIFNMDDLTYSNSGTSLFPRLIQKGTKLNDAEAWAIAVDTYSGSGFCADQNVLYMTFRTGGTRHHLCGTTQLQINTWYHLVITRSGNVVKFYLDGNEDASHNVGTGTIDSYNEALYVGDDIENSDGATDGKIDAIRFYTGALTLEDINSMYSCISLTELMSRMDEWKNNQISINDLLSVIQDWKRC